MTTEAACTKSVSEEAERFFYNEAGCAYTPGEETPKEGRMRGARALAHAEAHARENNWDVRWTDDLEECIGCECGGSECPCFTREPHETLCAMLVDEYGSGLASLSGICGATNKYRRVVEAELALEAQA